jgi:peptidyl-prolyl cis-trans isomerase SurA
MHHQKYKLHFLKMRGTINMSFLHNLYRFSWFITTSLVISACSNTKSLPGQSTSQADHSSSPVVGEVNGTRYTYVDLMDYYTRNVSDGNTSREFPDYKKLDNFLDLYLNFRAKILAAHEAGYYKDPKILKEFNQYETEYAYKYWFDHKLKKEFINELINRAATEVHVAHILIRVSPQASPKDTLKAWKRLMQARKDFHEGVPFSKLVKKYSTIRNRHPLGGDLGFFSAGMVVKPFEDVAYNTPTDSISMPFRTRYGYHMIYVKGTRKAIPDRRFSHIFFRTKGKNYSIASAMKKAKVVYKKLQSGVPWDTLVQKYSEDPGSRRRNGDIGWVNRNQYLSSFTDTVFAIPHIHMVIPPFYSGYGVQIVRLDSIRSFNNDSQKRNYFWKRYQKLPRFRDTNKYVLKSIEKAGNAKVNKRNYENLVSLISKPDSVDLMNFILPGSMQNEPLYSINGKKYLDNDFLSWLQDKIKGKKAFRYHYSLFQKFKIHADEEQLVPVTINKFPEFAHIVETYLDGLSIYQITQDSVWIYAQTDTIALRNLYKSNPGKYRYKKRYSYYSILANNDTTLHKAENLIKKGMAPDSLRGIIKGNLYVSKDEVNELNGMPYSRLKNLQKGQFSKPFSFRNKRTILYLDEILKPRDMTFREAYDKLVSDYQSIRKVEWMNSLHKRYHIKSYPQNLKLALENNK